MIEAEEKGVTSSKLDEMLKSQDPAIKRLLGVTPGMGKALKLDEKSAYNRDDDLFVGAGHARPAAAASSESTSVYRLAGPLEPLTACDYV